MKKRQCVFAVIFLGIVLLGIMGCSREAKERDFIYNRLKAYIDEIKVVDTHEHQSTYLNLRGKEVNLYTLLARSYLNDDLISAGAPRLDWEVVDEGNNQKLWETFGRYLDFTRNTSYYRHLISGFRLLYGFTDDYFTEENTKELSLSVKQNYKNFDDWYDSAFKQANFDTMFVDPFWDNFKLDKFYEHLALVMRIDMYISSISTRARLEREDAPKRSNPFYQAQEDGYPIQSLEDYLGFAEGWFQKFVENQAVCAKSANAYQRSIDYEDVPFEEAKSLFGRPSEELSPVQKKKLQDFMFHWCVEKCSEYDLPLQIHTGYFAGSGSTLDNGRPIKLNNLFIKYKKTKFILFHGGYPWYHEVGALAKMFPNVYIDIVWLPQISREAAVDALHQWLDLVPYNKIFWGGDCLIIEGAAGALEDSRDMLAQVLAERVKEGRMTEEVAKDVAVKVFRENAIRVFRLEKKLGRDFF